MKAVLGMLEEMEERDARVLKLRYGLEGQAPLTLKQIGAEVGLTRERSARSKSTPCGSCRRDSRATAAAGPCSDGSRCSIRFPRPRRPEPYDPYLTSSPSKGATRIRTAQRGILLLEPPDARGDLIRIPTDRIEDLQHRSCAIHQPRGDDCMPADASRR